MKAQFLILFQTVLDLLDSYTPDLYCSCSLIKQMRPCQTHRFKNNPKAMTTHKSELSTARTWCWPKDLSALSLESLKRWSKDQGATRDHALWLNGACYLIQIGNLSQPPTARVPWIRYQSLCRKQARANISRTEEEIPFSKFWNSWGFH